MTDIKNLLINEHLSLHDALALLDRTAQGVLLLVDQKQKLIRTVTDGDIRRLLLEGHSLDATLIKLPQQLPRFITTEDDPAIAITLMEEYELDHIPVVDAHHIPQSLIHRRELNSTILMSTPHLGEFEQQFVAEAFKTNWIAPLGPNVDAFEKELADYIDIPYAAALSSGTAAIHLALRLLNVGPGDTVFCSSLTFVASANPILYQGATPVFIDSEPESWNLSQLALARAFEEAERKNQLPKAVVVVNLYGQSADMDTIIALCERYQVPIVEDAAESLGTLYKGKASGTFGKFGIFSFNGNKIITTSGGGMLVSHDEALIKKARFLSTQAREPALHYEHTEIGYNYRMSNILAGIGRGQLKVLEQRVAARRQVFERYVAGLTDIPAIDWMPEADYGRSTRWLTAMLINPAHTNVTANQLIAYLANHKIEARPVWKPMHLQPLFKDCAYYSHSEQSISEQLFYQGVCLPSGSNLSVIDQERVIQVMKKCFQS